MGFINKGRPCWETYIAGTGITPTTEDHLLVKGSRAVGAKYLTAALTTAATDKIDGVTAGVADKAVMDPYTYNEHQLVRVQRGQYIWVRTGTAYTAADYGKGIKADATANQNGWATVADDGVGRIDAGKTDGTKHYLGVWLDKSD